MSSKKDDQIMLILSIIERGKAKAYMDMLSKKNIFFNMQTVGAGTASSEMMDILGLGSNDKDIVFSYAPRKCVEVLATDLTNDLGSGMGFGGLLMILSTSAISKLTAEVMIQRTGEIDLKGDSNAMKSEYQHSLIMINVNPGYTDKVMHTAKKAGATGGTVIRARKANTEKTGDLGDLQTQDEKEIITILAPDTIRNQIMEEINKEFGMRSEAKGIVCSVPVDKAFKI